jgi:branched-chain amino acid transport system substrate-binding protein
MAKKIFITIGVIAVIAIGVFLYLNKTDKKQDNVKIGAILPLSGDAAIYGKNLQNGLFVALEEYNSQNEPKVNLVFEDSKAEPKMAVTVINKLIFTDKVKYIIGDMFTNTTLAIAPIAQQNKVLLLSPTGSSNEISKVGSYVFRIYPSETEEGNALGDFYNQKFAGEKAFIICANEDAMKNVALTIQNKITTNTTQKDYNTNSNSFISIIENIPVDVKVVFALGYLSDISLFVKQSKELKRNFAVVGLSTLYDEKFIELISSASEGIYLTAPAFSIESKNENIQHFMALYNKKYKELPNVWAGYGYDSFEILIKAISESNETGKQIFEVMENLKDYDGVTGLTTIYKDHSINKTFNILQIKDGKFIATK